MISVNRAEERRLAFEYYPRSLRHRLPKIGIPLADCDPDVPLDLQAAIAKTYEAGSYRERLHYDRSCVPPLSAEDQAWAFEIIGKAAQLSDQPENPSA